MAEGRRVGQARHGWWAVPAQVTLAGVSFLSHACSTTLQSCHSALVHRTAGARVSVAFVASLVFPAPGPGGGSRDGKAGGVASQAPPQPSARHTASEAQLSQKAPQAGSQDSPSQTSTVPPQWLLPFTRRTPSCCPGIARRQLRPPPRGRTGLRGGSGDRRLPGTPLPYRGQYPTGLWVSALQSAKWGWAGSSLSPL